MALLGTALHPHAGRRSQRFGANWLRSGGGAASGVSGEPLLFLGHSGGELPRAGLEGALVLRELEIHARPAT